MNLRANLTSTYSIVARDPDTGQLGIAVQTHQMCVGSRIMWLQAGLGAAITQSLTDEIEKVARRYPEQYLWGHRRWKD